MTLKVNESMLDVLMYLFENYMETNCDISRDQDELVEELEEAGFYHDNIHKAFIWLEELSVMQDASDMLQEHRSTSASRVYDDYEYEKIGQEGLGLIHFLEQIGVLNTLTRELVIDRALALEGEKIEIPRLKWVVLMILFSYPGQDAQLAWMEEFILNNRDQTVH